MIDINALVNCILLWNLIHVNGQSVTLKYLPYEATNSSLSSASFFGCYGYKSCAHSSILAGSWVLCDGGYSCFGDGFINNSNSYLVARGYLSCSFKSILYTKDAIYAAEQGWSSISCIASYSCVGISNIILAKSGERNFQYVIGCSGSHGCMHSNFIIKQASTADPSIALKTHGTLALYKATIIAEAYSSSNVTIGGFYGGYGAVLHCLANATCRVC